MNFEMGEIMTQTNFSKEFWTVKKGKEGREVLDIK